MGGRGRGRGTGLSFSTESLGFNRGDALPPAAISPPPLFPTLTNPPPSIVKDAEHEYIIDTQRELCSWHKTSPFNIGKNLASNNELVELVKWSRLPRELHLGGRTRKRKLPTKKNKAAPGDKDIAAKLEKLEKLDDKEKSDDEGKKDGSDDENKENAEDEEKEEEVDDDADDPDEEMDGGTDYANNYFDNGDDYEEDENDNLDEGGIY